MNNYYSIPSFNAYVSSENLVDAPDTPYLPCRVIGLSFYTDEAVTFVIKLEDGEVFSYISPTDLVLSTDTDKEFDLDDLVYFNSPSFNVSISILEDLKGECSCFFKHKNKWIAGEYLLTIDFYNDNELFNLIFLSNHQLAFLPFHKVKFKAFDKTQKSFKNYKKQRKTYIVGGDKK